jgi:hypothetical protein
MKANLITATIVNASLLMALVTPALSQSKESQEVWVGQSMFR